MHLWLPCNFGEMLRVNARKYASDEYELMDLPFTMVQCVKTSVGNQISYYTDVSDKKGHCHYAPIGVPIGQGGKILDSPLCPGYEGAIDDWFDFKGKVKLYYIEYLIKKNKFRYAFSNGSMIYFERDTLIGSITDNEKQNEPTLDINSRQHIKKPRKKVSSIIIFKFKGMKGMDKKLGALNDNGNNQLAKILWSYVVEQCKNVDVMVKVVESGKKSSELVAHITAYARKKATGNMAMLPDSEVFAEVNKFYGIENLVNATTLADFKPEESVTKEAKTVTETSNSVSKQPKSVTKAKKAIPEGQFDLFSMGV